MSTAFYSLRIRTIPSNYINISNLLKVEVSDYSLGWIYEIERPIEGYFDYINYFLDLLDGKYEELKTIGIERDDISIWLIDEYEFQCNFEITPKDLIRLGENGITFCFSCYEVTNHK